MQNATLPASESSTCVRARRLSRARLSGSLGFETEKRELEIVGVAGWDVPLRGCHLRALVALLGGGGARGQADRRLRADLVSPASRGSPGRSGLPGQQARKATSGQEKGCGTGGRPWAGRVVLGRGRVGHVGRVGTIMRAAGACVCAVVGARASSRSDFAKPFLVRDAGHVRSHTCVVGT